jgi:hypothetical protein
MKNWAKQLAGTVLVLVFAFAVGGFVMVLRAQQGGLAATMAAARIRAVSPADGAVNVAVSGEIRADYISRPNQDPTIKFEPPVGLVLGPARWDGTTFVMPYSGLRDNSLYHGELDQDDWPGKGEHKQIKVRWSFRTGSGTTATPTARPTSSASPTASPSPLASTPPDSQTPLIWYRGSSLVGLDWNSKPVKSLSLSDRVQSPDGLRLWSSMTPSTEIDDANGNAIGSIAGLSPVMWADDSRELCGITYRPYNLELLTLDGKRHPVGPVSVTPGTMQTPQLAACSVLSGRAVVVGTSNGYVWSMSMISLRDGSIIYTQNYPNPLAHLAASHDGRYIAEQLAGNANGRPTTLIRELPSGTVVGQLTDISVQAFSWDDSLVAGGTPGNASLSGAQVIRWQNHQVVWDRCGCPLPFEVRVLAQPGGTKLAIVGVYPQQQRSFTIVDANGEARSVPVGPIVPAF